MYIPPPAAYTNTIHNTRCMDLWLKSIYQMDSYRGSSYIYLYIILILLYYIIILLYYYTYILYLYYTYIYL